MLKNKPYDKSLDVWCLGILLYELLHGGPPFKGKTDTEKINNIKKNADITYSSTISKEVIAV
jgi:serine/threonine protein kinase